MKRYDLDNRIVEASVLDRAELAKRFAQLADAIQSRILSSALSREIKEDILRDMAGIPVVLDNVARSQSKLRRSKNGQKPDEDVIES